MKSLPAEVDVGLATYGHTRKDDCSDIEILVPPGSDRTALIKAMNTIYPKGMTPLTEAMRLAAGQFQEYEGDASVVVVSDGKETCTGDPCAAVREALKGASAHLRQDKRFPCCILTSDAASLRSSWSRRRRPWSTSITAAGTRWRVRRRGRSLRPSRHAAPRASRQAATPRRQPSRASWMRVHTRPNVPCRSRSTRLHAAPSGRRAGRSRRTASRRFPTTQPSAHGLPSWARHGPTAHTLGHRWIARSSGYRPRDKALIVSARRRAGATVGKTRPPPPTSASRPWADALSAAAAARAPGVGRRPRPPGAGPDAAGGRPPPVARPSRPAGSPRPPPRRPAPWPQAPRARAPGGHRSAEPCP